MIFCALKICLSELFKIDSVMREQRSLFPDCVGQLLVVFLPKRTGISRCKRRITTFFQEFSHQYIDVFIQIEFNEELAHGV